MPNCLSRPTGYYNCTTACGPPTCYTLWCTSNKNCDTSSSCPFAPVLGGRFCSAMATGGACGIVAAKHSNPGCGP
jgi:hypothetical protein